jgi:hypothetical protein
VGLLYLGYVFIRIKKLNAFRLQLCLVTFASVLLPLFFNQGSMAYDIEQFTPYSFLAAGIFTIIAVNRIFQRIRFSSIYPEIVTVMLLLLITFPSNLTSLKNRIISPQHLVTNPELELFQYIKTNTHPEDIFMVYPSQRQISTLEFSAFTNRNTYISGRTLSVITGDDFDTRLKLLNNFFEHSNPDKRRQLVTDNQIKYLFVYQDELDRVKFNLDSLTPVYSNQAGYLYRFR